MTRDHIRKNIRIMFPECAPDRIQKILRYLRDDNAKDHHCAGSLTHVGRCAVDHAAADLIESLAAELEQVKRERDTAIADMECLQGLICQVCKEYYQPDPESREHSCRVYGDYFGEIAEDGLLCCSEFKWRGIQEENSNA